jgi:hypothetical protein
MPVCVGVGVVIELADVVVVVFVVVVGEVVVVLESGIPDTQ